MAHNVTARKRLDQRGPYTEEVSEAWKVRGLLVPGPQDLCSAQIRFQAGVGRSREASVACVGRADSSQRQARLWRVCSFSF